MVLAPSGGFHCQLEVKDSDLASRSWLDLFLANSFWTLARLSHPMQTAPETLVLSSRRHAEVLRSVMTTEHPGVRFPVRAIATQQVHCLDWINNGTSAGDDQVEVPKTEGERET